jgi:hypothetical protein
MAQINKPNQYFNTIIYTGNNNQSQTISGVGFQPDWIWIKNSDNTEWHHLMDAVRGDNKFLHTNTTGAESTGNRGNGHNALAFTSDGFSITNATQQDGDLNFGSRPYPTWCWKAGGTASSNTDGDVTTQVSVNTTAGFSIATGTFANVTSQTVGHGLGVAPSVYIMKKTNAVENWANYHKSLGATKGISLSSTSAAVTNIGYFNNTEPTSQVVSFGSYYSSTSSFVLYSFAEKKGFSKFGSYTGNGNADGTFVYTGFKPAFVMVKNTQEGAAEWMIVDNKRSDAGGYNLIDKTLSPNNSNAELDAGSTWIVDFLSNGFKWRINTATVNANNQNHIYMAFAENPLVGSNNISTTAR